MREQCALLILLGSPCASQIHSEIDGRVVERCLQVLVDVREVEAVLVRSESSHCDVVDVVSDGVVSHRAQRLAHRAVRTTVPPILTNDLKKMGKNLSVLTPFNYLKVNKQDI